MGEEKLEWDEAWTLDDFVIQLMNEKKTDSLEWKLLIRIYGQDHIKQICLDAIKRSRQPLGSPQKEKKG